MVTRAIGGYDSLSPPPEILEGGGIFPPGDYKACDPALVFSPANWEYVVMDLMTSPHASVKYRGYPLFIWTTKHGDGVFPTYMSGEQYGSVVTNNCLLCLAPAALLDLCARGEDNGGIALLYRAGGGTPRATGDGDVVHGEFEVITSLTPGEGPQTLSSVG